MKSPLNDRLVTGPMKSSASNNTPSSAILEMYSAADKNVRLRANCSFDFFFLGGGGGEREGEGVGVRRFWLKAP